MGRPERRESRYGKDRNLRKRDQTRGHAVTRAEDQKNSAWVNKNLVENVGFINRAKDQRKIEYLGFILD